MKAPSQFMGYFDEIDGTYARGWAVDAANPDTPITVEAVCEGVVLASTLATIHRGDLAEAGIPTTRCGFRFPLGGNLPSHVGKDIVIRIAGTDGILPGSPRRQAANPNVTAFLTQNARLQSRPGLPARLAARATRLTAACPITILMHVHDTPHPWLLAALNSLLTQRTAHWTLIVIDDASTAPHIAPLLAAAARHDPRIRILRTPTKVGPAQALNFGLRAATGVYVAILPSEGALEPGAIDRLATTALATKAGILYADEAITAENLDDILEIRARPAFSYDYLLTHPYIGHPLAIRTDLARSLSGWDETSPAPTHDLLLRAIEQAPAIAHIPAILYRGRATSAPEPDRRIPLSRHLARIGQGATLAASGRIEWPDDHGETVAIIPTRNRLDLLRPCIESLERTTKGEPLRIVVIDHQSDEPKTRRYLAALARRHTVMPYAGPFNYARMNNRAVRAQGGKSPYILLLNNDIEALEPGWLPRLRSLAHRPDVGAVGPRLLYPDRRIQHAGVILAFNGTADHAGKLAPSAGNPGPNGIYAATRDYSAVTAACMLLRRDVFAAVKGFDEGFVVGFNDTDLCLRLRAAGLKILYDGATTLLHHESQTRLDRNEVLHPKDDARLRRRWPAYFTAGDPFYSPLFATGGTDHVLRTDPACKHSAAPRLTRLGTA